jgi:RNA methyltransferase, TrmH family
MPKPHELKLYGVNAVRAAFRVRPDAIIKCWLEERLMDGFRRELKGLAAQRRGYTIVATDELDRLTASTHHEGICVLVSDAPALSVADYLGQLRKPTAVVLALPDVGNPHNLGAIARSAAHFGVDALLLNGAQRMKSGAAMRTAEGALESLRLIDSNDWESAIAAFRGARFELIALSGQANRSLYAATLPQRALFALGGEAEGLAPGWLELADQVLSIPGTGAVESLNVSVAAAVVFAEHFRRFQTD